MTHARAAAVRSTNTAAEDKKFRRCAAVDYVEK